jgi:hypothetical protein
MRCCLKLDTRKLATELISSTRPRPSTFDDGESVTDTRVTGSVRVMTEYRGKCLCGAVRYVVEARAPQAMFLCHCSRCRRESGSVYGATVFFEGASLRFESGEATLTAYSLPGTRKNRQFCKICGSPMPRIDQQETIALPAGSLDDSSLVAPTAHIHCDSEAEWTEATTSAPRFGGLPE